MKTRIVIIFAALCISGILTIQAQETIEPDIQKRLDLIKRGNIGQVRAELHSLLERYPHNPGVLYLQGMLTSDGGEAVRTFQSVIDNFPKSDWADDALYKIYQYYYALGLYKTAEMKLDKLRRDYPQSPYLRSLQQQVSMQPDLTPSTAAQPPVKQPEVKPQPAVTEQPQVVVKKEPTSAPPTAVVKKETAPAIPPPMVKEKKETPRKAPPTSSGSYTVQTGVFSSRQNAERYQSDLERANITAEVRVRQIGGREMYAVCVGFYPTYEEAQRYVETLKEKNITGIVIGR